MPNYINIFTFKEEIQHNLMGIPMRWLIRMNLCDLYTSRSIQKLREGQFGIQNQPNLHVFELWEENGVPGVNPTQPELEPGTFLL